VAIRNIQFLNFRIHLFFNTIFQSKKSPIEQFQANKFTFGPKSYIFKNVIISTNLDQLRKNFDKLLKKLNISC